MTTAIIQDSQLPYYQQLYDILRRQITNGFWKPGDRMPSESELIDQYQVSRIVVRQAFDMLVNEGWVYRRRGRGTFVTTPAIEQGLTRIISFTEDMQRRGMQPGTQILSANLEPAPAEIAQKLNVTPGTELAVLKRLRLADDEPMSIEVSHLVHRLCPGILEGDYANTPLHEALMDRYDIRLVRATQEIRAVIAERNMAARLDVSPKAPLFYIERISYSQYGMPVEYLQLFHRGDRYVLYNELRN
ncbi:MAG: GntR family transcriptional regulator [Chloroflexota bacterium]